jgi:hypothetical protein
VDLERRRIHRDQAIQTIARRIDAQAPELELEAGDSEQRPGRGANLRGEVRQGREVVSGPRGFRGELLTRQLHAVTRIAREPDHGAIQLLATLPGSLDGRRRLAHRFSLSRVNA